MDNDIKGSMRSDVVSETQKKKVAALDTVLEEFEIFVEEEMKNKKFTAQGKEHEMTCSTDCMVTSAQNLQNASEKLLKKMIEANDYRKEEAAAKIAALLESQAKATALYAEFHKYYPDAAHRLEEYVPSFKQMAEDGHRMWSELSSK